MVCSVELMFMSMKLASTGPLLEFIIARKIDKRKKYKELSKKEDP